MLCWSAFLIGLLGSLHCAGMCGPLALALPATGNTRISFGMGRLAYNLGRVLTYCLLGALFGAIGMTFTLAGFQRWASITAGAAILIGLLASSRFALQTPMSKAVTLLRKGLGKMLARRTVSSIFLLGVLNGFLPCGLVYAACAGAVSRGSVAAGMGYMLFFGLGTAPVMLSIGLAGKLFRAGLRVRFQKLVPATLALLAVLLILRGMSLGIPYVSPVLTGQHVRCPACRH